jgi:hypothetical protein
MRFACLPQTVAALAIVAVFSTSAPAQELNVSADESASAALQAAPSIPIETTATARLETRRPRALVPLYASFVTLQILDLHSTTKALASGAVEANPAMKAVAGNSIGLTAMKAAGTAAVIVISEKLRTRNRAAAVGLMIAANSAMAMVVQHNYRAVR